MKNTTRLLVPLALLAIAAPAQADFAPRVSVGGVASTTGVGGDASWRFDEHFAVTARYTDGLNLDTSLEEEGVDYTADFGTQASSVKVEYFPFGGRFFLTAGVMMPDIAAEVTGVPQDGTTFELNGDTYSADQIGAVVGTASLADGTRPYLGLGARTSHQPGFGFFGEFGLMSTNADVSLSTTEGFEDQNATLQDDLRQEEQTLEDDLDKLPVFPVLLFGLSYTF